MKNLVALSIISISLFAVQPVQADSKNRDIHFGTQSHFPSADRGKYRDRDDDHRGYGWQNVSERGWKHNDAKWGEHDRHDDWNSSPRDRTPYYNNQGFGGWHGGSNNGLERGIKSGQLSQREVQELNNERYNLKEEERRYLSDGRLSKHEREDLNDDRQDYQKKLNHELNDGEKNYRAFDKFDYFR